MDYAGQVTGDDLSLTGTTACPGLPPPWLSVIMPSHCGERWIDATLGSVAIQADQGLEMIIVDSSPGAETFNLVQRFASRIRLRFDKRPDLLSWQAKTNFGVGIASAPHVCWLHQDDVWLPGRAAAIRRWIETAPDAVLHLAPTAIIDARGRRLGTWRCPLPYRGGQVPKEMLLSRLLVQNFVATPTPVFTRVAWEAVSGIDETLWYTADWDLWLKLTSYGPAAYHDEVTTGFRIHDGSLTITGSKNVNDFTSQMELVLNRHLPLLNHRRRKVERSARASICVNAALAAAAHGKLWHLPVVLVSLLLLGPAGFVHYLRDSTIIERLVPRVRAKLLGAF